MCNVLLFIQHFRESDAKKEKEEEDKEEKEVKDTLPSVNCYTLGSFYGLRS